MSADFRFVRVTPNDIVRVAERWRKQYQQPDGRWIKTYKGDTQKVYRLLKKLTLKSTIKQVEKAIGNGSWVGFYCSFCGDHLTEAVKLEREEESDLTVCRKCAKMIFGMFRE